MGRIATLTMNPTVDMSCSVERVVVERKLDCIEPRSEPGGGGINVARVARILDETSIALWTRGGLMGDVLQGLLGAYELDHQPIPIGGETRKSFIAFETSTNLQYRFGMPGPTLSPDDVERCLDALRALDPPPALLVLSGSLPPGAGADFYAQAAKAMPPGTRILADTRGEPLRHILKAGVYLAKPNVGELSELVGKELESDVAIEDAARSLVQNGGVEVIVTSIGAGGAVMVTRDRCVHVRSPTVPIRSKVGAGDSMVGGIARMLVRGAPIVEAVRYGIAAGAAAVMTPGTELCRKEDVERLYSTMD